MLVKPEDVLRFRLLERKPERYRRFALLRWWRQQSITQLRILIVGTGAIGACIGSA